MATSLPGLEFIRRLYIVFIFLVGKDFLSSGFAHISRVVRVCWLAIRRGVLSCISQESGVSSVVAPTKCWTGHMQHRMGRLVCQFHLFIGAIQPAIYVRAPCRKASEFGGPPTKDPFWMYQLQVSIILWNRDFPVKDPLKLCT